MDERRKTELIEISGGKVRFDCPMAQLTTLKVGGPAEALVTIRSEEELQRILAYTRAEGIPCLPVGRGSNLLVTDAGIAGLVALVAVGGLERDSGGGTLTAGAGETLGGLLSFCRGQGLGGLEFLAGIPGSVGGAVAMNAGAFGRAIGESVQQVRWVTASGKSETGGRGRLRFSYRRCSLEPGSVIVRARLAVGPASRESVSNRIADLLRRRRQTQPVELPSAGSVFKNPPGDTAGRLIESVGLKGTRVGGAMISPLHANYIVNTGGARARDVLELLELARERVEAETGVELEPEIRVVGRREG